MRKEYSGTEPAALALAGMLLLTLAIYLPGLPGSFLFDDWSNLPLLGHQGVIDQFDKLITYLLTGFSGPTGRPVATASFLLDTDTWPAPPGPFKRTNLLIHLLNGALLTALLWQLCLRLGARAERAAWTAVIAAGCWLLHPLWVSTTLYIVQRMTLLSGTFVLAGLVTYLHGRRQMLCGYTVKGYFLATFAVCVFGLLALLSKENGALLPLLILVVERYGMARDQPPPVSRGWQVWKVIFLITPSLFVLAYLATALPALFQGNSGVRDFTPGQRLLTQGRILMEYLGLLLFPRPHAGGLFTDTVAVSTGLFQPVSTLFSLAAVAVLIALAEKVRRTLPTISLALMFFLSGHLLESTWIQLELRFEHRNYLPAVLLFLPLAWWLASSPKLAGGTRATVIIALACLLAGQTLIRADLWGKPFIQALAWARQNPHSPRAQNHLASFWASTGNHAESYRLMKAVHDKHPNDLLTLLGLVGAQCRLNDISAGNVERLLQSMRKSNVAYAVGRFQWDKTLSFLRRDGCRTIDSGLFEKLIEAGLKNPRADAVSSWRQMLYQQRAQLRLAQNRPEEAYTDLMHALNAVNTQDATLASTALLANRGHLALALRFLDEAPLPSDGLPGSTLSVKRLRQHWLAHTNYYYREREELRRAISEDLKRESVAATLQVAH